MSTLTAPTEKCDLARVEQVEVDQFEQGLVQRRGVVKLVAVLAPAGLNQGLTSCGLNKPGWPSVVVMNELARLRAWR